MNDLFLKISCVASFDWYLLGRWQAAGKRVVLPPIWF